MRLTTSQLAILHTPADARRTATRRGNSFERAARVVIERHVELAAVPRMGGRMIKGGKMIADKAPCDFVGAIRGTGQLFIADAKSCSLRTRFDYCQIEDHQRDELIRLGMAGAIAGVIVEASAVDFCRCFWIDWRVLAADINASSIAWTDERLIELGSSGRGERDMDAEMIRVVIECEHHRTERRGAA
jgi:hypothetical protein